MYAVIQTGGKQYRVQEGDTLKVERLDARPGAEVRIEDVRLVGGGEGAELKIGTPQVAGAAVLARVLDHMRAPKVYIFKTKRRKNARRQRGHRQAQTILKIARIEA